MQASMVGAAVAAERRQDNLALAFQELLTVGERLRSHRQVVSDANSFRGQIREALKMAHGEAQRYSYSAEDIQLAAFAVIAFLDECILNLRTPIFADWPRQPLQEEYFGHHIAGEVFFQHLQTLMSRPDSVGTADVLEVYQLCLLLGFAGRYSLSGRGELQGMIAAVGDKIRRIRRPSSELSPAWQLPRETASPRTGRDPVVRALLFGALFCLLLCGGVFLGGKLSLGSILAELVSAAR